MINAFIYWPTKTDRLNLFSNNLEMSNLSETVENLLMEYSNSLEYSFKERGRHLRCSFCNRKFKYQMVLHQHAIEKHLVNLKNLTDEEQKRLILEFLRSDPEILYQDYHQKYFFGEKWLPGSPWYNSDRLPRQKSLKR